MFDVYYQKCKYVLLFIKIGFKFYIRTTITANLVCYNQSTDIILIMNVTFFSWFFVICYWVWDNTSSGVLNMTLDAAHKSWLWLCRCTRLNLLHMAKINIITCNSTCKFYLFFPVRVSIFPGFIDSAWHNSESGACNISQ